MICFDLDWGSFEFVGVSTLVVLMVCGFAVLGGLWALFGGFWLFGGCCWIWLIDF